MRLLHAGQICSAVALLEEAKRGDVSHVTEDVSATGTTQLTEEQSANA
jgi:xanthine dehydrogenase YagT iron-sulfur-binding subunit